MSDYAITPKLPVPSLRATLDRFLTALKPLLTATQLSEAASLTRDFSDKQGPYLQRKLVQLAEETDNWAGYVTVHARYLSNRASLLLTNGVGTRLTPIQIGSLDAIHSLSLYICTALSLSEQVRDGKLPQETLHNQPLCMQQYKSMFGVSRLPGLKMDSYSRAPASRHIILMHRGGIHKVPVYRGGAEEPVSAQEMYTLLSQVLTHPQGGCEEGARSVGLLTALKRDQWYSVRERLRESPINMLSLAAVEGCLFSICLDDYEAEPYTLDERLKLGLFGDLKSPYFNRWFGLSHQSMMSADGYMSNIMEHSLFDGGPLIRYRAFKNTPFDPDFKIDPSLHVELLKWDICPPLQAEIARARAVVSTLYTAYDVHALTFSGYGKDFLKSYKLYPHGYIQMALQLAYFKLYHGLAPAYHPVSLRKYHGGRLEHPHTVSEESRAFVEAMSRDCPDGERYRLMLLAMARHREFISDASQGQAYCKHMLALRMLAEREGLSVELFQKEVFKIFTEHRLATAIIYYGMPVVAAHPTLSGVGHFVTFQMKDGDFNFSVTTLPHPGQAANSQEFSAKISASLSELQQLVVTNGMLLSKI